MDPLYITIGLVVFGLAGIGGGIWLWRNAAKVTADARHDLSEMFQSAIPEVFQQPTSNNGAKGTAVGFIGFGIIFLVLGILGGLYGYPTLT